MVKRGIEKSGKSPVLAGHDIGTASATAVNTAYGLPDAPPDQRQKRDERDRYSRSWMLTAR